VANALNGIIERMSRFLRRRDALQVAGAALLGKAALSAQAGDELTIDGKQVELTVTPVSATTVRISMLPLDAASGKVIPLPADGALAREDMGSPAARLRFLGVDRSVRCGDLKVTLLPSPFRIRVEDKAGRTVQSLRIGPPLTFSLGNGPVFGLGPGGGAQLDRLGQQATVGQGGLIPFLIGTSGWAMFVHQPAGSFDLSTGSGVLQPQSTIPPIDIFVIAEKDPALILAEYARITGLPELPPLAALEYQPSLTPVATDDQNGTAGLSRVRAQAEAQQRQRPNERVYAVYRGAGYPGMQRYGAFLAHGGAQSRWDALKAQIPMAINAGLSGNPFWGPIPGGGPEPTDELYVRWFQFAAFNALFTGGGDKRHDPSAADVCKRYLELRTQLMPYIYSSVRATCETGMPVVRGLWLHYPEDPIAVAQSHEYLFGRDLLVVPVFEHGATTRRFYLPPGDWYDFWTRQRVEGSRDVIRGVNLETIPLYARAGAIVPLAAPAADGPLSMRIYPGADGLFTLYEDDGKTLEYRKGDQMKIEMNWLDAPRRLQLRLAKGTRIRPPLKRPMLAQAMDSGVTREAVFDGNPLEIRF